MSGIAGIVGRNGQDGATAGQDLVGRMAATVAHRGTGEGGDWHDDAAAVSFAVTGGEPAVSPDGRWVILLDGEIHNSDDLRRRLDAPELSHAAAPALVAEAVARWGIDRALAAMAGAFALAVWDRVDRVLHLVRDRLGERPLFWGRAGGAVVFGSELKALRAHPRFDPALSPPSVAHFLRLGWVGAPATIHAQTWAVPAGTAVEIRGGGEARTRTFWSVADRARAAEEFTGGAAAAAERLNILLRASVAMRLRQGRPAAVSLSGGPASALVAAITQDLSDNSVIAAGIGNGGAAIARRLGAEYLAVDAHDGEVRAIAATLARTWDEPIADPGQVTAALVMRGLAGRVGDVLTGTGAGPLFGGSPLYARIACEPSAQGVPGLVRRHLGPVAAALGRAPKASVSPCQTLGRMRQLWDGLPEPGPRPDALAFDDLALCGGLDHPAQDAMAADLAVLVPNCLAPRADRAAMACGIDPRHPFLEASVVDFALSLPVGFKLDGGAGMACVREVLCRYLPPSMLTAAADAPPPLAQWLAGPLAQWAGDLLSEATLKRHGWIDPRALARARRQERWFEVWVCVILQAWLEESGG